MKIGHHVYLVSQTRLYKIELGADLNIISSYKVNDFDIEVPWAYGLAYIQDPDAGMGSQEYKILSFDPMNIVYAIDPETGYSDPFCISSGNLDALGAASLPIDTSTTDTSSTGIRTYEIENNIQVFPIPVITGCFI